MSSGPSARDVVAVTSRISAIDDDALTYRGIPIGELFARSNFEEVVFLLWFGRLPSVADLSAFHARLAECEPMSDVALDLVRRATPGGLTRTLEAGIVGLALGRPARNDAIAQPVILLCGLPEIVAAFDRLRRGKEPLRATRHGTIAHRFLAAWRDDEPMPEEVTALDRSLVLVADHELNAATYAARVAASTGADLFSVVIAAIATQSGPLHAGALQDAGELLSASTIAEAEREVVRRLENSERIPGFGHPVYRRGDPRAAMFRILAEEITLPGDDRTHHRMADRIAEIVTATTGLTPNLDLYAAASWSALGIPPDLFPAIFAIGRVAGWIAHVREQIADNRLIRPRAHYTGSRNRRYTPIEERGEWSADTDE